MPRTAHRLRVTLEGSDPEIWRSFTIDSDLSLGDLHRALQTIMGWRESHLHQFMDYNPWQRLRGDTPERRWGDEYSSDEDDMLPEGDTPIDDVFAVGAPLWYEYDFGDGWVHRIDVIGTAPLPAHAPPVGDIDGANRCPYEDSGGIGGYYDKLATVADPSRDDHDDIKLWVDETVGPWSPSDPAFFDPLGVQAELNLQFNTEQVGVDPSDMSGLSKDATRRTDADINPASPIAAFVAQLPAPARSELRQHLHRTGALDPSEREDESAARCIRPYAWLLEAVGTKGLALTRAGWLPPTIVTDAMTALEWTGTWIGKGNREDLTAPVAILRETAQRMGLVRVVKGRLVLSAASKRALGDPHEILRLVAAGVHRRLTDIEADAAVLSLIAIADGTRPTARGRAVAFGLWTLGWQPIGRIDRAFTPREIDRIADRFDDVVTVLTWGWRHPFDRAARATDPPDLALFARHALR